ncbi:AI-2E family transporter [Candidatus Kaiserbacteria bacterium]|nr:AI-2E family transporter [Candidatus Kaiserbacteria bacterium]
MDLKRITEYIFFFGLISIVGYIAWLIFFPFIAALVLSSIMVILCYPLFEKIIKISPKKNRSFAAAVTTLLVFFAIVIPTFILSTLLVNEFVSFYKSLDSTENFSFEQSLGGVESMIQAYVPTFELNITEQVKQSAEWLAPNIGAIFAGTVSVIFTFLIAILGSFYLFKDGKRFMEWVVEVSPLPDNEDKIILARLERALRSIAMGTLLLSIVQGTVAAIGFSLFGIDRAILLGSVAALGALLPGIGTAGIMIPAVLYLFFFGSLTNAIGLTVWAIVAIALVDNLLGPYLMSRGNNLHPFVVLLAVLGGISVFGPIGFIIGPVVISLLVVLIEIYMSNIAKYSVQKKK